MPKLTLRDLFAVVTVMALALGWYIDRSQLLRERNRHRMEADIVKSQLQLVLTETIIGSRNIKIDNGSGTMTVTRGNKTITNPIVRIPDLQTYQTAYSDYDAVIFTLPARVVLLDVAILAVALAFGWALDHLRHRSLRHENEQLRSQAKMLHEKIVGNE